MYKDSWNMSKLHWLTGNEYGDLPLPLSLWPVNQKKNPCYIVRLKLIQKLHWDLRTKMYAFNFEWNIYYGGGAPLRICASARPWIRSLNRQSYWCKQYFPFLSNYFLAKLFLSSGFLQGFLALMFMTSQILTLMTYPHIFFATSNTPFLGRLLYLRASREA